jgi:hypothetical protein
MNQNHKNKVTDEQLIDEFNKTPHLGILKSKFNLPDITIWRRLSKLGLKTSSKGGKKIQLSEILEGMHPYYQTFKLRNRLIKEGIKENKCEICGISEWNNKAINCQLDHIDGNNSNHRLENLRLICPNCHSQTDTYCGKNKD